MNMPINTNPRPCENKRINPIPWEDEKKDLGRLPKGKYGVHRIRDRHLRKVGAALFARL